MTAVGGAALATTAVVVGIGAAVGDVTQRFQRLQELTRRTNVDTQQLTPRRGSPVRSAGV